MNWYKKAIFGTTPFVTDDLTNKTKISPYGFAGGDEHTGLLEPSGNKPHAANDYFSESNPLGIKITEGRMEELRRQKLKNKKLKNKKKLRRKLKRKSNFYSEFKKMAQFGSEGQNVSKISYLPNGSDDWVYNTFEKIEHNLDKKEPETPVTEPIPEPTPIPESKSTIQKLTDSTVSIITKVSGTEEKGTGFFINEKTILTCYHVVHPMEDNPNGIDVVLAADDSKSPRKALLFAFDEKSDIAALILHDKEYQNKNFLPVEDVDNINIGDNICFLGSPYGYDKVFNEGIVSSEPLEYSNDQDLFFISSKIYPGSSGSAIVQKDSGKVIGMASAMIYAKGENSANGLNGVTPIDVICEFLDKNGIKYE